MPNSADLQASLRLMIMLQCALRASLRMVHTALRNITCEPNPKAGCKS